MDLAAPIPNQQVALATGWHAAVHREGIEWVDERDDLLTEAHVEARRPGQGDVAEDADHTEAELACATG